MLDSTFQTAFPGLSVNEPFVTKISLDVKRDKKETLIKLLNKLEDITKTKLVYRDDTGSCVFDIKNEDSTDTEDCIAYIYIITKVGEAFEYLKQLQINPTVKEESK